MSVPTSEVTAFQAVSQGAMDLPVTVQRATHTSDGAGGYTETFAAVGTTVCSLALPSAELLQAYATLIGSLTTWVVRMPVGANVQENDRLVVGGTTLRVQVLFQPRTRQIVLRLLASQVQ